jgi:hypothetical protein
MSDFSELCPLFETGVFHEVTFPNIDMTGITGCGNALMGSLTVGQPTASAMWTFGRTVIVTGGFVRTKVKPTINATVNMHLHHHTSQLAVGTVMMTLDISTTVDGCEIYSWAPMNSVLAKTFTSNEILGFTCLTGTASGAGTYDLIVRYKEA